MSLLTNIRNAFAYKPKKDGKVKVIEFSQKRITPKVDEFIDAVYSARNKMTQSRSMLYDHYQQTLTVDNVVRSMLMKRLDNIQNKTVALYDGDNELVDLRPFFESPKFREFITNIVMVKFWGMSLFEFSEMDYKGKAWFDYKIIPIKHINPYNREVLISQNDSNGEPISKYPECLFLGDADDLGLLLPVTLLSLYRRLGMFNYGKYVDLASENFTVMMQREFSDSQNINRINDMLSKRDGGGVLSVPDGVDFRMENQSSSQQNDLFEGYMKMLKEEIAVLILGQTMTTSDGSSRSQAEVHQDEQENKFSGDERYVLDVLNYEFMDMLPIWGIGVKESYRFKFLPNSASDLKNRINQLKELKELGLQLSEEELRDKFNEIL
jgi:hypothetical protein